MIEPWIVKLIVLAVIVGWFVTTIAAIFTDYEAPASITAAFVALAGGAFAQQRHERHDGGNGGTGGSGQ